MGADWSSPLTTTLYADLLTALKARDTDALTMLYSLAGVSNLPTNAIRWNPSNNRFEKWDGAAWVVLAATYALRSADAATADTLTGLQASIAQLNTVAYGASARNDHVHSNITLTAGSGMSAIGDLSANRTVGIAAGGVVTNLLGNGAVTPQKVTNMIDGDACIYYREPGNAVFYTPHMKVAEVVVGRSGYVRVRWSFAVVTTGSGYPVMALYVNGVQQGGQYTNNEELVPTVVSQLIYVSTGQIISIEGWSATGNAQKTAIHYVTMSVGNPLDITPTFADCMVRLN